ncbi:MAG: DUF4240 domain-containing protein [Desulfobacteraceae bacterium]|nr:DUF4240 domain-containing protein [Desulfobacteraceae bacterium]
MNIDEFWQTIDSVNSESDGDMDRKCELLKHRLNGLNEQALLDFINHFDSVDVGAYT